MSKTCKFEHMTAKFSGNQPLFGDSWPPVPPHSPPQKTETLTAHSTEPRPCTQPAYQQQINV